MNEQNNYTYIKTIEELKQYKGKILVKRNKDYTWMFKLVDIIGKDLFVTQGIDIKPTPRVYFARGIKDFNTIHYEPYGNIIVHRLPTKEEMNLYRKYTREIKLLGTNKSNFGTK